ncbi:hypothetical protein ACFFKE_32235 [Streptomyces mutabilis]|uniref:hypothetical protein n=1 Tax=Streptomyces TaxID=1883 RepID=UPI0010CD4CA3|nr:MULTISPECIES: hypothetical protein [Streptomyces]QCR49846.1 hypothetical protein C1N79_26335 [Streptomyces sp. SGAir0924]GGQ38360.1 hypothetical protein GCM10010279_54550 [Streptomyces mutabilis]
MAGRKRGGADSRCPACGLPVLVQWVGDTAAIRATVTLPPADARLPYPEALTERTPNDLVWCLPRGPHRALRLRWTHHRHPPDCPHQHLTSHKCRPTEPTTLF